MSAFRVPLNHYLMGHATGDCRLDRCRRDTQNVWNVLRDVDARMRRATRDVSDSQYHERHAGDSDSYSSQRFADSRGHEVE